ncbi:MAG: HAD family phosphatase [Butyricicoccus sp.]|nr:HAD family phosphatase [Butyricicoccus sp.]MBQ8585595.1 HAD family phosphatase [Butyricicoccus sp.]
MIQGAIFDVDGTLLDTMKLWETACSDYLRTLGIEPDADHDKKMFEMTVDEGVDYTIAHYGLTQDRQMLMDGISEYAYQYYANKSEARPGMRELVRALQDADIPMAAATSSERVQVEAGLARNDMLSPLRAIFTCFEVGAGKHFPDVYEAAWKAIGCPDRANVWVFEDALYAVRTAKAAGFRVCGLYDPTSAENEAEIRALADCYCTDAADIARFMKEYIE